MLIFWFPHIFFRLRWYYILFCFFLIYFAIVFLSTLDTIQSYLRFGRLPFWLSRVGKRLPNTTVVHIYFLFHDIFSTFFSSANHQSILEKNMTFTMGCQCGSSCWQHVFYVCKIYFLIIQIQEIKWQILESCYVWLCD